MVRAPPEATGALSMIHLDRGILAYLGRRDDADVSGRPPIETRRSSRVYGEGSKAPLRNI